MSRTLLKQAAGWLGTLVARRPRRRPWTYALWLLAYLPPLIWMVPFYSVDVRLYHSLAVLIAIAVVLVQLIHPTILGWAVIAIPSGWFAAIGAGALVLTTPGRAPEELPQLVISSVAVGVYVMVCVALWFARPRAALGIAAMPGASPIASPAGTPPAVDKQLANHTPRP